MKLDLTKADPNNFRESIGFKAESFAYLPDEGNKRRYKSVQKKTSRMATPKKKVITAKTKRQQELVNRRMKYDPRKALKKGNKKGNQVNMK